MKPKKLTQTAIIVASRPQAQAALIYQKRHPRELINFIAADISSILFFQRHGISHAPLFNFISPPPNDTKLHQLPYQLTLQFLSLPKIKSQLRLGQINLTPFLTEMLRFSLSRTLEEYYLLYQTLKQLRFQKLIVSYQLFSPVELKLFSKTYRFDIGNLDQWHTALSRLQQTGINKWFGISKILKNHILLITHPILTIKAILYRHRQLNQAYQVPGKKKTLIFSSGLHLASYHSAIKSLSSTASVYMLTGPQALTDKFFLVQYGLQAYQFNLPHLSLHALPPLVKNLDLSAISSLPIPKSLPLKPSLVRHLIRQKTLFLLHHWLAKPLRYYASAQQAIQALKPDLVVTTHDPGPTGLAFTTAAQAKHLPTAILLHGSPSEVHFFFADKQITWGPLMKRLLVRQGIHSNRLDTAGYPIYFDYQNYFTHHPTPPSPPLRIGILTSGFGGNEINQVEFFIKLFPQLPRNSKIIIRTHPSQQLLGLQLLAKKYHLSVSVNPPLLLEEFIAQCHLVIAQDSTAALVPLLAHKPTIALPSWLPFTDRGLVLNTSAFLKLKANHSVIELISRLKDKKFLTRLKSRQQRYLRQYCGPIDQQIGTRIARQLLQMIK